jgi:probable addiction module antidote protein
METTRFDASELLDTPARRAAYLSAAFETGDPEEIRDALGVVARARGLAEVARDANLSRTSLYKTLSGNGNPEFGTVVRVLASLGIRLTATPAVQPRKSAHRTYATRKKNHRTRATRNATTHKPHTRKKPEPAHA